MSVVPLLVVIILVSINGYRWLLVVIGVYFKLNYHWLFMAIHGY
jgi:hypothetical protein